MLGAQTNNIANVTVCGAMATSMLFVNPTVVRVSLPVVQSPRTCAIVVNTQGGYSTTAFFTYEISTPAAPYVFRGSTDLLVHSECHGGFVLRVILSDCHAALATVFGCGHGKHSVTAIYECDWLLGAHSVGDRHAPDPNPSCPCRWCGAALPWHV
jgi:hypothetical protein